MTRKRAVALVLIALYLPLALVLGLPDRLILFPTTDRINAGDAVRKAIPFENGELELWTAQSQLAKQAGRAATYVLRFYGNADRADRWVALEAEMWDRRAVEAWGVNYPGYGGSTGPARLSRIGPSALAAFDRLQQTAGDRPSIVFGASVGATAALHVAANRTVTGVILHNPPALREVILRQFGWWNLWLLAGPVAIRIPQQLDSVANARRIRAPGIFLLAERDEVIAPKYQQLVVNAYAGEKRVITLPGADHNSPIEGDILSEVHKAYDWILPR
jgi:fermentation-respiration switch protein FrsA (DUF1100 family)